MSSIPNSAMPHADASQLEDTGAESGEGGGLTLKERAGQLASSAADLIRENPKTAAAAGAALVAGAVAAAAIPAVRARRSGSGGKSGGSGGASGGGSRKKKS
jgi:hypothetical protein